MMKDEAERRRAVLQEYYLKNDFCVSPEGILKILSIVLSTISSIIFIWGGWCNSARLSGTGAYLSLCTGALLAVLCAVNVLYLDARAPLTCFLIDLTVSAGVGAVLVLVALLSLTVCGPRTPIDYIYGLLSFLNAAAVLGSSAITYTSVSRMWDAISHPDLPQPQSSEDSKV